MAAAAERLSYTPSAVSQHLAALEREAGVRLLERVGRGVRPTAAGRLLAEQGDAVIDRLAAAEAALADLRTGRAGLLRMRFFATAGASFVPPALAIFRGRHPDAELDLAMQEPPDSVHAVRAGEADIAIAVEPVAGSPERDNGLCWTQLLDDEYFAILPANHPLVDRGDVALADLAQEQWVDTEPQPSPCSEILTSSFAAAGFSPQVIVATDDYPTTQGMVAAGLGISLVPLLALDRPHPGVVVRRLRSNPPIRRILAVVRAGAQDEPFVRTITEALRTVADSHVLRTPSRA
ncbi:LysR family transcriptional regulator [Fodinicola feengrottensis]|uniref:LysR family transcriptional regulator n=2 Tax=Fodinicola feengrottensis TaxID=435914 RepID=A0ABN2FPI2_9ACTN